MPPYPGQGWSIERNDVNGNYEPANCKWIPLSEQPHNMQRTIRFDPGQTLGRWTVISGPDWDVFSKGAAYTCRCKCGTERVIQARSLKYGYSQSCGCLQKEKARLNGQAIRFAISQKRLLANLDMALGNRTASHA